MMELTAVLTLVVCALVSTGCCSIGTHAAQKAPLVQTLAGEALVSVREGVMTIRQQTAECTMQFAGLPAKVRQIRIDQPDRSSRMLIRTVMEPTELLGMIQASGSVYIVNPNGGELETDGQTPERDPIRDSLEPQQ